MLLYIVRPYVGCRYIAFIDYESRFLTRSPRYLLIKDVEAIQQILEVDQMGFVKLLVSVQILIGLDLVLT